MLGDLGVFEDTTVDLHKFMIHDTMSAVNIRLNVEWLGTGYKAASLET